MEAHQALEEERRKVQAARLDTGNAESLLKTLQKEVDGMRQALVASSKENASLKAQLDQQIGTFKVDLLASQVPILKQ